jgi:hypothetical protein
MVGRSCHNHASWSSHLQQMRSHRRLGSVHQWLLRWTWPAPSAKSRKGFMLQGCKKWPHAGTHSYFGQGSNAWYLSERHNWYMTDISSVWMDLHSYKDGPQNCWPISTCFKSTEAVEFGAPTRSDLTGWKQEVSTGSREVWDSVHQWLWGPTYPEPLLSPPEIDDHWKGSPSFTGCRYGLQYYTW